MWFDLFNNIGPRLSPLKWNRIESKWKWKANKTCLYDRQQYRLLFNFFSALTEWTSSSHHIPNMLCVCCACALCARKSFIYVPFMRWYRMWLSSLWKKWVMEININTHSVVLARALRLESPLANQFSLHRHINRRDPTSPRVDRRSPRRQRRKKNECKNVHCDSPSFWFHYQHSTDS